MQRRGAKGVGIMICPRCNTDWFEKEPPEMWPFKYPTYKCSNCGYYEERFE
jgi:hypothetical protein